MNAIESPYDILGVSPTASLAEIKHAYRVLCRKHHPDRNRNSGNELFHRMTEAYEMLSDPVKRFDYDGYELTTEELQDILSSMKCTARDQTAQMKHTVDSNRSLEQAKNGLIIHKAIYGDLKLRESNEKVSHVGKVLDITIQLQIEVHNSALFVAHRIKSEMEGVYDPAETLSEPEKELYILYSYSGHLFEMRQPASDPIELPNGKHKLILTDCQNAPHSKVNGLIERRRVAAMRNLQS